MLVAQVVNRLDCPLRGLVLLTGPDLSANRCLGTIPGLDAQLDAVPAVGIPVEWRAMGNRILALVLEGDESAAVRAFRRMCDDLDVADREMAGKVVWDTIDLIAAGATPGVFADALAPAAEDCEPLVPLMTALQRLAGRPARVPEEFDEVVGDVVRTIEDRRGSMATGSRAGSSIRASAPKE